LEFGSLADYVRNNFFFINQSELNEKEWNIQKGEGNELLKKIRSIGLPIEEYVGAKINYGIKGSVRLRYIGTICSSGLEKRKRRKRLLHE
jgi:hypothetical protein